MTTGPYKTIRNYPDPPAGARWTRGTITRCGRCVFFEHTAVNPDKTAQGKCFVDRPKAPRVHGHMVCPRYMQKLDLTEDFGWSEAS